jgi:hypothetical protein
MSQMVVAEEPRFLTEEEMQDGTAVRTTRGEIETVDLNDRSAIISGYIYDFGSPNEESPVVVKMYRSNYGAFELLQPGMKVEILYGEELDGRSAIEVQQLSDNEVIGDY